MRDFGLDFGRHVTLAIIGLGSAFFLFASPQSARAQEVTVSSQPDVVQAWSAEVRASVERRQADAERALQLLKRFRESASADEKIAENIIPPQVSMATWPSAYVDVLQVHASTLGFVTTDQTISILRPALAEYSLQTQWYDALSVQRRRHYLEPMILRVLESEGLPKALLAVPWVESGFNSHAQSPKGARGLWQLMPDTAKRFGLDPDARFDERIDPARSTVAAVRYLKELYELFGDWPLALAAYNAGEGRIQKALAVSPKRDFWTLVELGLIPKETRQYVPSVLAAARQLRRQSQSRNAVLTSVSQSEER